MFERMLPLDDMVVRSLRVGGAPVEPGTEPLGERETGLPVANVQRWHSAIDAAEQVGKSERGAAADSQDSPTVDDAIQLALAAHFAGPAVGQSELRWPAQAAPSEITANPVASPLISVADIVVGEGDGIAYVTVSLSAPGTNAVSVNYATAAVTASSGSDFTTTSGTLNFAIGETSKVVQVTLLENASVEGLEHFRLNLSAPVNATIAKASAMVGIVDNDSVVATPGLYVRDVVVDEAAGTASFVVMLGGPTGQASASTVTVDYNTANGSAVGTDYVSTGSTLTFTPGQTVKTVVVDLKDDATAEGAERFLLNLSNAVNATIVDGRGVATIGANDGALAATPTLSVADMVVGEGDGYIDVVVSLSAPSASAVSVVYATQDVSADDGGYDYDAVSGTLNFAAGETTKTVRIQLESSASFEYGLEHFRLNLSAPTNATLGKASGMISIVDNDTVAASPELSCATW
ncbi:MAG: hypothetical protein IPG91_13475 [Ideonella sp.]|nr:hypothetical protein [Ideonella sp.]